MNFALHVWYTQCHILNKNSPKFFCHNCIQYSFTDILCGKFAIRRSLKIPPHPKHVATLPREVYIVCFRISELYCNFDCSIAD